MDTTATQIINYFGGFKQYLVPLFQRQYEWSGIQWRTLWEDIVSFYSRDSNDLQSTHFMGAVVTMPARSVPVGVAKFMVIDGQQRLTTIALLLCAIRDVLTPADNVPQRRIQNFYLTNDGYEGLDFFKVLPTQADRVAYSTLIQKSTSAPTDSQFKKAYDFFRRQLRGQDDDGNQIDPKRILELVETRLMVVSINLSDGDDPYLIFESLNFKGSPLKQADLVRNYFLMRFSVADQQAVYDGLWKPMQELDQSLTDFMRHFLGAEGEDVRKGDVYAAIKRLTADSDASSVRLLMQRMAHLSLFYSRISTAAAEPNDELRRLFVRFHRLDFGTAYPLLLSLYEDYADGQFSTEEFIASLRILDSYIIRRMVAGVPSNQLSGVFISLCKSKPITDTPSAWLSEALAREGKNRRWPTDAEFFERWLKAPLYTSRACPVILECLEEQFGHHETVTFSDASVEHVLPQTLSLAWQEALGDQAAGIQAEWLHTIGNLTLSGYNSELGNKTYVEKSRQLAESHFELNKFFNSHRTWGASEIRQRAEALFALALQVWPRPALAPEEEPVQRQASKPANFHSNCVRYAEKRLGIVLSKLSQTRYESGEQGTRLVCAVSAEHNEDGDTPFFWFSVHRSQLDFLEHAPSAWLCFGCGSADETLVIPVSVITPLLAKMSESNRDDRQYWHVVVHRKNGKLILRLLGAIDGPDLSEFLVSAA